MTERARTGTATQLALLESGLAAVAKQVGEFVEDSNRYRQTISEENREQRRIHSEEQAKIWGELRAQGERFNTALEKLSGRGAITWPLIAMVGGFVFSIGAAFASMGHFFVETRIKQVEIAGENRERRQQQQAEMIEKLRDAEISRLQHAAGER